MDARRGDLARFGWAFVALDGDDKIAAIARGVPPKSTFRSDCGPCVEAFLEGEVAACSAKRPLARVNSLMHHVMDDVVPSAMVWMPAHTSCEKCGHQKAV